MEKEKVSPQGELLTFQQHPCDVEITDSPTFQRWPPSRQTRHLIIYDKKYHKKKLLKESDK